MTEPSSDPSTDLSPARASRLPAALRAMRPRQWVKNVLVFAAPLAAGSLLQPDVIGRTVLSFVAFCFVSAAVYLVNDARDVEADRLHPTKRRRPIAAGELSVRSAVVLAVITAVAGIALGWAVAPALAVVLATYVALQLGYSWWWKNQPIIDLAMVSSGFLLRAIAGGVASAIPLSQWFLLVASFGSLFMVAGKRYSELVALGSDAGTRASLARYTPTYLRFVWTLAATAVIMSYSLWAFEHTEAPWGGVAWAAISIAPFTLGLMRYAMTIDAGRAGEPEVVVLGDRVLQVLGLLWAVPVAISVFA